MSAPQVHAEPPADASSAVLLRQVALSQATRLAREGSYAAAEELLSGLLATERPDVSVLDLLARIRVQQGALLDAESLWRKVLQLDPNHLGARAGLERLRGVQRKPVWFQPVLAVLIGLGVIFCGVFVLAWQTRRQAAANVVLQQRVAGVVGAGSQTARQQTEALLAEVKGLKSNQAEVEASLERLGNFATKLDEWSNAQEAVSGRLAEIQAEAKRSAGRQESVSRVASNQVETVRRAFKQELASVKDNFEQQMVALQADGKQVAVKQEASGQTISNQVAALHLVVDRERALVAEIDRRGAAAEKLQLDYHALAASHERLLAQAALLAIPPKLAIAVPGVKTSVSGNSVAVAFDEGLFDHGTHFNPSAKERLLAVAKALSQSSDQLQIQTIGYADDDRAFLRWTAQWESALAMGRASAVVGYFVELELFRAENVSAVSGDSKKRPFPSDSVQNRVKNRTVVLHVTLLRN